MAEKEKLKQIQREQQVQELERAVREAERFKNEQASAHLKKLEKNKEHVHQMLEFNKEPPHIFAKTGIAIINN